MLLLRPVQDLEHWIEARLYAFDFCKQMYPKKAQIVFFQISGFNVTFQTSSGFRTRDWGEVLCVWFFVSECIPRKLTLSISKCHFFIIYFLSTAQLLEWWIGARLLCLNSLNSQVNVSTGRLFFSLTVQFICIARCKLKSDGLGWGFMYLNSLNSQAHISFVCLQIGLNFTTLN